MANSDTLYLACDSEALRFNPYPDAVKQILLNKHFIYSILLSNTVTIPVGCYFESVLVQTLVDTYRDLFLPLHDQYPVAGLLQCFRFAGIDVGTHMSTFFLWPFDVWIISTLYIYYIILSIFTV